jgi:hypothetical protein
MHTRLRPLALVLSLAVWTACHHNKSKGEQAAAPAGPPVVSFTNQSLEMVRLYVVLSNGQQVPLDGTVQSGQSARLTLPGGLPVGGETVQFVARLTSRGRVVGSGPVSVRPGDSFQITLPPAGNTLNVLPGAP